MARRFFAELADAFIPGNAYNYQLGRWNRNTATVGGIGAVADQLIPGGSRLTGMLARRGVFGGNLQAGLRYESARDAMTPGYMQTRGQLGQWLSQNNGYQAPNITGTIAGPQGLAGMLAPGRPQGGYTNFTPTGPVGGVQRQQFTPDSSLDVRDVDVGPIGISRSNMAINGSGRSAPAGQMGGGASGGTFARGQADVLTGDAARGYYDSMRMGSLFGFRQTGGNIRGHLYEK